MTQPPRPDLNKASALVALTPPSRSVHRELLTIFVETGHSPSRDDLERIAARHDVGPRSILAELAERDVVAFDASGEIRAAYPFSPSPTSITVTWEGGPTVYSMCAIDALGTSAMLDRPVIITAAEPDTGEFVIVEVDGDHATWTPETAVVFAGSTDDSCCPSVDRTCGHINFFTSDAAARGWADRHPGIVGCVLGQHDAVSNGIAEFGDMLRHSR